MTGHSQLSLDVIKLLEDKNLAFVATLMEDGSPQITPTWIVLFDGLIIINTAKGRVKQKNLSRDNRVAVSIVDHRNPYNMVTIRGKVIEQMEKGADEHIDKMAKKYLGVDKYPFRTEKEKRVLLKILPEKVFHMLPQ